MTVEHETVRTGEGWKSVAARLCPPGTTTVLRTAFATKLATANGKSINTAPRIGEILHYDTADLPVVAVPVRQPTTIPFTASSPWNTKITAAQQAEWMSVPILNTMSSAINGDTTRYWYGGEGQLVICRGSATDPLWTITMPDFGNNDTRFNRYWKAATWTMRLPAAGPVVGGNEDSILCLLDETDGSYADIGNGSYYTIDRVARTITGVSGVWWARGNVDTGTGVGGLLPSGNSAGVRAANFAWMAGAITGYDVDQVMTGKKTDFGHALAVMLTLETLSMWGVTPPATGPNNGNNYGPIKMGSRLGIPASTSKPSGFGTDLIGNAFWNTLQRYGAFVGDYTGGPWPIVQFDSATVPNGSLNSMWVWWEGNPAGKWIAPLLRVMEG